MSIRFRLESGFSLIELMVATGLLLVISSIVTSALLQVSNSQRTISNRTEMHSGIRGATELLQQEVGQAGRVSLPGVVTLASAIVGTGPLTCDAGNPTANAQTVVVESDNPDLSAVSGIFAAGGGTPAYELMTTLDGNTQESIKIASVDAGAETITACFQNDHAAGAVLRPLGAFATGIIPPTGIVNGSTGTVLKLYGDVNGNGEMVYIEYTCDPQPDGGNLYRNVMAFDEMVKPAVTNSQILLGNIIDNPDLTPCFTYQTVTLVAQGTPFTFVLDVAVTLTVQTEQLDPITNSYQTETKALLNVSPRNVFNAWTLASIGYTDRIQSTPLSITNLLPALE